MVKVIFLTFICCFLSINNSFGQNSSSNSIYFDAIAFNADSNDLERIDCFLVIPYSELKFTSFQDKYISDLKIIFDLQSESGEVITKSIEKKVVTDDYFESQGGTGKSKIILEQFYLKPDNYVIKANLKNDNKSLSLRQSITIIDFDKNEIALSGLMLLSSIEEGESGLKITPYFSDNVAKFEDNFFAFFEIYNNDYTKNKIQYAYQLIDENNTIQFQSDLTKKSIKKGTNRDFLMINSDINLNGKLNLRIYALDESANDLTDSSLILTASERVINFSDEEFSDLFKDIDLAIRQLRYVTDMEKIDQLKELETEKQKRTALKEFWRDFDPTPRTSTNEALIEYYNRIKFANENFKSYADGWLTDMGMVYIVLGKPDQVFRDNQNMRSNITYERWVYDDGRAYIFEDRTGFSDFRLVRPMGFNEKYKYNR